MNAKHTESPKGKRYNVYSLIRFSTARQEWGTSLKRQTENDEADCKRQGWNYDKKLCITDLGVSAFRGKNFDRNKALGKFIEASQKGLLEKDPLLKLENLDRFSRDILESAEGQFWGLVKRGVDIFVKSMGMIFTNGDQNDVMKKTLVMFEFDRSHKESARKSQAVNFAFKEKYKQAANGEIAGLGKWVPKWVEFKGKKMQAGEYIPGKHWNTIKTIVSDFIAGGSLNEIVGKLNTKKTPTLFDGSDKWSRATVRYILGNQSLLGHITVKGQTFKNHIPAMVNKDEWNLIQDRLRQNTVRRGGVSNGDYIVNLFANRCKCKCGGVVGARRLLGKYRYYFCRNDKDGIKCTSNTLKVEDIEHDFFLMFREEMPEALLAKHNTDYQHKLSAIRSRIATHETNVGNYSKAIRGTKNIQSLITELNNEQAALEQARAELEALNTKAFSASQVPAAIKSIREAVIAEKMPVEEAIDRQLEMLNAQLEKPEVRKRLRELIPSLLDHLVIDLDKGRYAVVNLAGARGEWHQVV